MIIEEIKYQYGMFSRWFREFIFKLRGVNRLFYCQREIECELKCETQCSHCKEYYSPLEKLKEGENL